MPPPEQTRQGAPRSRGVPPGREKGTKSFSFTASSWCECTTCCKVCVLPVTTSARLQWFNRMHQLRSVCDLTLLPRGESARQDKRARYYSSAVELYPPSPSCLRAFLAISEKGEAGSRSLARLKATLASSFRP